MYQRINILLPEKTVHLIDSKRVWADYDDEADVLYVSFHKPQQANDSIMEDNVIRYYRDKMLVGMTILGASRLKE